MRGKRQIHASCVDRDGAGVLLLGRPGAGKSDLTLRLLDHGFALVADDQVLIEDDEAAAPAALAGLLEVRGLGLVHLPYRPRTRLALAVALDPTPPPRLPQPETEPESGLPLLRLDPFAASAPSRVALALDCALGRRTTASGCFAP